MTIIHIAEVLESAMDSADRLGATLKTLQVDVDVITDMVGHQTNGTSSQSPGDALWAYQEARRALDRAEALLITGNAFLHRYIDDVLQPDRTRMARIH